MAVSGLGLLGTVAGLALMAVPAGALATPIGQNGSTAPQSTVATIMLFVGIPVLVLSLAALFFLPAKAVGALKYRPGRPWGYDREWFGTAATAAAESIPSTPAFPAGGSSGSW